MTKSALEDALRPVLPDATRAQRAEAVDSILATIVAGLRDPGGRFDISGFGAFRLKPTAARTGRHPRTGEAMEIPAGVRLSFSPHAALKAELKPRKPAKGRAKRAA